MMISEESTLDWYCRGMIFGNKGSVLLVRVAHLIKEADEKETEKLKNPKKKQNTSYMEKIKALKETAQEAYKYSQSKKAESSATEDL